ncbi:WD domain, G-beta repeat-containing protein [Cardiosporidium cionae]|uniref:WD domain, G-beta repeat-containing protein n=1 Tax=Cardiosporidium cionae TaxID=476202 RepID=A0ABQ7JDL7_9APIC|nr:WD domain, G-beta repeat-containing protein [Cardiosporidium cionae]|eukprot:KAF8822076.1 WD domain, G-beta repeat-containing protein [Cardiosporidium cionae]
MLLEKDSLSEPLKCSTLETNTLLCIRRFSKGFICGGTNASLRIFETSEKAEEVFQKTGEIQLRSSKGNELTPEDKRLDNQVISIAVSPSESIVVVALSCSDIFCLNLSYSFATKTHFISGTDFSRCVFNQVHIGPITGGNIIK